MEQEQPGPFRISCFTQIILTGSNEWHKKLHKTVLNLVFISYRKNQADKEDVEFDQPTQETGLGT